MQLEKIYLPLYLYINGKEIDDIDIKVLSENMMTKKKKYYLYLSDTYLFHLECIKNINDNSKKSKAILRKCKLYIYYEYIKLKKELGYPYKSDFKNSYVIFYLIKQLFTFLNMVMMIIFSIIAIFGADLYNDYGQLIDWLTYIIAIIVILDTIVGTLYICYKFFCMNIFETKREIWYINS